MSQSLQMNRGIVKQVIQLYSVLIILSHFVEMFVDALWVPRFTLKTPLGFTRDSESNKLILL